MTAFPVSDKEPETNPAEAADGLIGALLASANPESNDAALQHMELRHRTKNILTIVQALVNQTLRGDVSIDDARAALSDRLIAMGNAVDHLMENDWEPAELEDVVARALNHRARFKDRVTLSGPRVPVGSGAAMSLSLALHELESNAIKYGALSNDVGGVTIEWSVAEDPGHLLRLEWREEGGPLVTPPTRHGFGTKLISTAIGRRLRGSADLQYETKGFRWILTAPVAGFAS